MQIKSAFERKCSEVLFEINAFLNFVDHHTAVNSGVTGNQVLYTEMKKCRAKVDELLLSVCAEGKKRNETVSPTVEGCSPQH